MRQRLLYSIWQTFHFNVCSQFLFMCNDFVLPKKKILYKFNKILANAEEVDKKCDGFFPLSCYHDIQSTHFFRVNFEQWCFFAIFFLLAFHV